MPPPLRVPLALRLLLMSGLVLLLVLRGPGRGDGGGAVTLEVVDAGATARILVEDPPPAAVQRISDAPPDPDELLRLRALSAEIPLELVLPGEPPPLRLDPPRWARAERASALRVEVHAPPGSAVRIQVEGDAGVRDTVEALAGPEGRAVAHLPFRSVREGWHRWWAALDGDTARGGILVAPSRPLRVLALAGGAGWEPRFVLRALEESGVSTTLRQPLGGGRWVVGSPREGARPLPPLEEVDVVLLLPGGELPGALAPGLDEWVAAGGGIVAVPGAGDTLALPGLPAVAVSTREQEIPASSLEWTLPPELVALPSLAVEVPVLSLPGLDPGGWIAGARGGGGSGDPVLGLTGVGSGRVAVVGLPATWLWRMEGGALAEHRTFWRRMMEWAAAGGDRGVWALPPAGEVPGATVEVQLEWTDPEPPALRLRHPDGSQEPLDVTVAAPGRGRVAFVAASEGLHVLVDAAGEGIAGVPVSRDGPPALDAFPSAVRLAGNSGGGVLPAGETSPPGSTPSGSRPSGGSALLLLGLLAAPAVGEWVLRRLRGIP